MLFKEADDRTAELEELDKIAALGTRDQQKRIIEQRRNLQAGIKAEQQSTYLIDFYLKDSKNTGVIHDLRLDINGRVAQIDHLLVLRSMDIFVVETKGAHAGFKITETGEFLRWNNFNKSYEGMPSPIAQNARHIAVLADALKTIELPRRLGIRLTPKLHSLVVVDPKARIDRPTTFDTSSVIKADVLVQTIEKYLDGKNVIAALAQIVSQETVGSICKQLVRLHKPAAFNYQSYFGISVEDPAPAAVAAQPAKKPAAQTMPRVAAAPVEPEVKPTVPECQPTLTVTESPLLCSHCDSHDGSIQKGRYGWYWKCHHCAQNTSLKFICTKDGAAETIRKDGLQYFHECPTCGMTTLFHMARPESSCADVAPADAQHSASVPKSAGSAENNECPVSQAPRAKVCRHCSSGNGGIQHGRFGYYWKCADCDKNTPLDVECGKADCTAKLRKEKLNFFVECGKCGTSVLYHTNAVESTQPPAAITT